MSRQIGLTLGVSLLVAIIGTRSTYGDVHHGFELGWLAVVVISVAGAVTALRMTPKPANVPA